MGRATARTERHNSAVEAGPVEGSVKDDAGRILYFSRRYFGYGGRDLERGEVLGLTGELNDDQLKRLKYVLPLLPGDTPLRCRVCSKRFIDHESREHHGRKAHEGKTHLNVPFSQRGATVDETAEEVQELQRQQHEDDQRAPLDLDKTEANRARV